MTRQPSAKETVQNQPLDEIIFEKLQGETATKIDPNMTIPVLQKALGRKLERGEISAWRRWRQNFFREQKQQKQIARQSARKEAKEKKKHSLLGLSNAELCAKLIHLENLNREPNTKLTNHQLVHALIYHTVDELAQIVAQTQTFTQEQQQEARHAIQTLTSILNSHRIQERQAIGIVFLTPAQLREEILSCYAAAVRAKFPELAMKMLKPQLQAAPSKAHLVQLRSRVAQLRPDAQLTAEMKQEVIEFITGYIQKGR